MSEPRLEVACEDYPGGMSAWVRETMAEYPHLEEMLRSLIRRSIAAAAAEGGVVIVAHAAAIALAGDERAATGAGDGLARNPGPPARRAAGLDLGEAKRSIERSDRGRAAYLKSFYGIDRERPIHYDLVLNTDRLSATSAAALISEVAASGSTQDALQAGSMLR